MKLGHVFVKAVFAIIGFLSFIPATSSGAAVTYTSIDENKCAPPRDDVLQLYEARGLYVEECKGIKGWRLFVVATNERSWIDLRHAGQSWTSEERVVQENTFGHFPNVTGSTVEWNTSAEGSPSSLIFRVNALGPGKDGVMDTNTSRYYVIELKQNKPTFCGLAKSKEQARALSTSGKCDKGLKELPRPRKKAGNR